MKKYYKDCYGCTASITKKPEGFVLVCRTPYGTLVTKNTYRTERGAKIALGKTMDIYSEVTK